MVANEEADLEDDKGRALPGDTYGSDTGDLDEYGRLSRQQPISEHRSPFFTGPSDIVSITSSRHEDEEANLMPQKNRAEDVDVTRWGHAGPPPPPMRSSTTTDIRTLLGSASLSTSSPKKPTLPPPPFPTLLLSLRVWLQSGGSIQFFSGPTPPSSLRIYAVSHPCKLGVLNFHAS
ncbi:hypothetical protein APHAL10511_003853 [Amanita phalloides]|nr:hypothetical protein APHAL10511_003853 [Amanita phalloides]